MEVTQAVIKYGRKFNLGDYEAEDYSVEMPVALDGVLKGFADLKSLITTAHSGKVEAPKATTTEVPEAKTKAKKEVTKEEVAEVKEVVKEEVTAEEVKEAPAKKAPAKKLVKASKETVYDRTDKGHKEAVKTALNAVKADWCSKENLATATKASTAMVGKPLLDEAGNVIESFVTEFLSHYE